MNVQDLPSSELSYFYGTYLKALGNLELMEALEQGKQWFSDFILTVPEDKMTFRYAPEKWSIAEVLVHLIDTERIFQYRAFRISRNDKTPLPGFEQDDYILESESNTRKKADILEEFLAVRAASITLFKGFDQKKLLRTGTASNLPWSVAGLGLAISGHQKHHENILKERYLF